MTLYVFHIDNQTNVKIWSKTKSECVVQLFKDGDRSRKATAKIRHNNGNAYIICKGHRYYLDKFKKVVI